MNDRALSALSQLQSVIDGGSSIDATSRHQLLPLLFRLKSKPYTLDNYPQFASMYPDSFVSNEIFMTARQVGKSMNLSRSEGLDAIGIENFQQLYVAPLQSQAQRYSNLYLREAIHSCAPATWLQDNNDEASDFKILKAVFHQTFGNGAGIQLTYAKTSPDRARGISCDRIDFDEVQDQMADNIPVISESLTASDWALRRFTGTAKTLDNTIEHLWQQSSMAEWVMKCQHCGHYNIPTMEGRVLEMIHADGVYCVGNGCGRKLNVRIGEWVPAYPDRELEFRGRHIPQIVVPAIVESPVRWQEFIHKMLRNSLPFILQEMLGISSSLGTRLITQADIDRQSVLGPMKALQKDVKKKYIRVIGGVDWGGAEQVSFTVHTILGIRADGGMDVLWAQRFEGFDPDTMLKEIARAHYFYGCDMLAADYGMGFDKNVMMEKRFGIAVVQIMYSSLKKLMVYSPTLGHHRWVVDKVTAMELMFMAIRYGRIRFPSQDDFKTYTDDLLSPFEKVIESGGFTKRQFDRNPSRPDDFAHALTFAALLAMRTLGAGIEDMVPEDAFGANEMDFSAPEVSTLDPADVLAIGRD